MRWATSFPAARLFLDVVNAQVFEVGIRRCPARSTARVPAILPPMSSSSRRPYQLPIPELNSQIDALLEAARRDSTDPADVELARQILVTGLHLLRDRTSRSELKLVNSALKELRHAFRVFKPYAPIRKVAVFGSARTREGQPDWNQARAFSERIGKGVILVDGAQSVPHLPTDVRDPQIDFLAFSGHKLFGPTGIGVLYGRRELLEAMDPFLCGGNMISEVHLESSTWAELPSKFEAGTIPIAEAIGLGAAIDYLQTLGFDAIHAQETRLLEKAMRLLPQTPGVTVYGPSVEHRGSIISFTVEKVHPHDLADLLDQKGVAIRAGHHCTMPLHDWLDVPATARASFAFYNTEAEVDALIDAIHYARHKFRLE